MMWCSIIYLHLKHAEGNLLVFNAQICVPLVYCTKLLWAACLFKIKNAWISWGFEMSHNTRQVYIVVHSFKKLNISLWQQWIFTTSAEVIKATKQVKKYKNISD